MSMTILIASKSNVRNSKRLIAASQIKKSNLSTGQVSGAIRRYAPFCYRKFIELRSYERWQSALCTFFRFMRLQ